VGPDISGQVEVAKPDSKSTLEEKTDVVEIENVIDSISGIGALDIQIDTVQMGDVAELHSGTTGFMASEMNECVKENSKPNDQTESIPFIVTKNIDKYHIKPGEVRFQNEFYEEPYCEFDEDKITSEKWEMYENNKVVIAGMVKELECSYDDTGYALGVNLYTITESDYSLHFLTSIINSTLITHIYRLKYQTKHLQNDYLAINKGQLEELPIPKMEISRKNKYKQHAKIFANDIESARENGDNSSEHAVLGAIDNHLSAEPPREGVVHDVLAHLAREMTDLHERRARYDLDVINYVGERTDGLDLPDIGEFQPADDAGPLAKTADDLEKLKIGSVSVQRTASDAVTIKATARYKPDDPEGHELDQWGYTETDWFEAFELFDLDDTQAALIEHFVPAAVDRGDGFAGFRDNATKTISPLDRIKSIQLPDLDRVQDDLRRFVEAKSTADELDRKIEFTDELIDQIVYRLYDLTDEEIEIVEAEVGQ
jgi:hypothetical protein